MYTAQRTSACAPNPRLASKSRLQLFQVDINLLRTLSVSMPLPRYEYRYVSGTTPPISERRTDEAAREEQTSSHSSATGMTSGSRVHRRLMATTPYPRSHNLSRPLGRSPVPSCSQSVRPNTSVVSSSEPTLARSKSTVVRLVSKILGPEPAADPNAHDGPSDEDGKFRVDPFHPLQSLLTHGVWKAKAGARKIVARAEEKMEKKRS
jgi:hypothetical protein